MKYILYFLFVFISWLTLSEAQINNKNINQPFPGVSSSAIIDSLDTVVFDMSQAVFVLNSIQFPVYILSNDTVNALDFAFKYNHNNLSYDSIANLAAYIQAYSYYNTTDSTVRYTSNSMHVYANDSALAGIHFSLLNGNILLSDINSVVAYLNGDPCPVKIIGYLPNYIDESKKENETIKIFSDNSAGLLHIETKEKSAIQMFDLNGRECINAKTNSFNISEIDIKGIPAGVYLIRVSGDKYSSIKKVVIE